MLQLILIAALIIEIFLYVVFGLYWRNRGNEWLVIVPALGVIAVGLRLLMALPSFMLSGAFRVRDNQQQPWGNALYALAKEIDARAVSLSFSQVLHQLLMPKEPIGTSVGAPILLGNGTPVLLVHGYFSNRGIWWRFRKRLADAGLGPIYAVTLSPLWGSIDEMVPQLATKIEAICKQSGHENLIVIAHSMGGLVTRAYMASSPNAPASIKQLITLASPHTGTQMANFGVGQCVGEMNMKSGWLAALERSEETIPHPPTVSIYTLNDDLVYPPENSRLAWAENIPVAAIGHVGLLFSKAIAERVIAAIKK
jgi:triacylglycerol lipase